MIDTLVKTQEEIKEMLNFATQNFNDAVSCSEKDSEEADVESEENSAHAFRNEDVNPNFAHVLQKVDVHPNFSHVFQNVDVHPTTNEV